MNRKTTQWGTAVSEKQAPKWNGGDLFLAPNAWITISKETADEDESRVWRAWCSAVDVDVYLKATSLPAAKLEAVGLVRARLTSLLAALDAVEQA